MNPKEALPSSALLPCPPRNKQLENGQSFEEIWKLAQAGSWLNMKQLAKITTYSYGKFTEWRRLGLPLIEGKIRLARFTDWVENELPKIKEEQAAAISRPTGTSRKYL